MTQQPPEDGSTQSFEYLGDAPEQPVGARPRRGRRALVGVTVGALVVAGAAGALAVAQFMSGGPQAATAAPADTMGWLQVDLDPAGGQKVAAYRTMRKFPTLEKHLGLTSDDDLRQWAFEGLTSETDCDDVDFDQVDAWLGSALGVGALPGRGEDGEPTPFFVLEVTDRGKAASGIRSLSDCLGEDEVGTAFTGDFMVVAETSAQARSIADAAEESALADDPTYQARTGEAGDDGIVTGYLAPALGDFLADRVSKLDGMFTEEMGSSGSGEAFLAGRAGALTEDTSDPGAAPSQSQSAAPGAAPSDSASGLPSDFPSELMSDLPSDFPTELLTELPSDFPTDLEGLEGDLGDELGGGMGMNPFMFGGPGLMGGLFGLGAGGFDEMTDALADFGGAAMHLRFADESLELEMASHGLDAGVADSGTVDLADLPGGTGLAFGAATGEQWATSTWRKMRESDPESFDEEMAEASRETGLSFPDDFATLAGDSVTVAFDSSVDFPALFESFFFGPGPGSVEAGVRIAGDPAEIEPLVQKLADRASKDDGPAVFVAKGDDAVAIGLDEDYVAALARGGDLGDSGTFEQALPGDDSLGAAFVDFDAGGWLDRALEGSSRSDKADAEPLSGLGATMSREDGALHATLRLTTD